MNSVRKLVAALLILTLMACRVATENTGETEVVSSRVRYEKTEDQAALKQALTDAKIPFESIRDENDKEFVQWEGRYNEQVQEVIKRLFPLQRKAHYPNPDNQRQFVNALKDASIPHQIVRMNDGLEYVQWEASFDVQVERIHEVLFGLGHERQRQIAFEPPREIWRPFGLS